MSKSERGQAERPSALFEKLLPTGAAAVKVVARTLRGGLSSDCVVHVTTRFNSGAARRRKTFVLKRLEGTAVREARIYQEVLCRSPRSLAPTLYHVDVATNGLTHLYLEAIKPVGRWPWGKLDHAGTVLERVGSLHSVECRHLESGLADWNYELELDRAAERTLELLSARARTGDATVRRSLPAARRLAQRLPEIRGALRQFSSLPPSVIHGDLHPGNVVLRRTRDGTEPVLIDWARCRVGSPLEDVASWLQWLGFWEPEVKRKHDTLLGVYLRSRGLAETPSRALRHAYWLAGAMNAYAGVITYHLAVAFEAEPHEARHARALSAVHDCLRVIRRADAYLVG